MPMNAQSLYARVSSVVNQTSLEIRVRRVLRDFILGTLVSGSCLLDDVAQALTPAAKKGASIGFYSVSWLTRA